MEGRRARSREVHRCRMALQAERIHIAHLQQAGIRRAMRRVATGAAVRFYHGVFIDEWPSRLRVTLGADHVLVSDSSELVALERAMWIVTVSAFEQPFIDRVMEGLLEGHLDVSMAVFAELRLRHLEQGRLAIEIVNVMTTDATQARPGMRGTLEVRMRRGMTIKACSVNLLESRLGEAEEKFVDITAAFDVRLARSVTAFAGALAFVHERQMRVRIRGEALGQICVTDRAGVISYVIAYGGLRIGYALRRSRDLRLDCARSIDITGPPYSGQDSHQHYRQEQTFHLRPRRKNGLDATKTYYMGPEHKLMICLLAVMWITNRGKIDEQRALAIVHLEVIELRRGVISGIAGMV